MRQAGPKHPVSLWRLYSLARSALVGAVLGVTLMASGLAHAAALLVRHICGPPRRRPSQAAAAWMVARAGSVQTAAP